MGITKRINCSNDHVFKQRTWIGAIKVLMQCGSYMFDKTILLVRYALPWWWRGGHRNRRGICWPVTQHDLLIKTSIKINNFKIYNSKVQGDIISGKDRHQTILHHTNRLFIYWIILRYRTGFNYDKLEFKILKHCTFINKKNIYFQPPIHC